MQDNTYFLVAIKAYDSGYIIGLPIFGVKYCNHLDVVTHLDEQQMALKDHF